MLFKNVDFDIYKNSAYGIGFDARGSFSLSDGKGFGKNVTIIGADMSVSEHVDNRKKNILILRKDPKKGLYDTTVNAKREYTINFSEQQNKFCLSLHYNVANSYLFVNGVKI